jgi:hypothetical protein
MALPNDLANFNDFPLVGLTEKLARGGLERGAGIHHWKRPRALPFGTPSLGLWRHSPTGQPSWDRPSGPGAAPYPMECVARREDRGPIPKVSGSRPFMKARYQRAHQGRTFRGASSRCHSSAASNAGTWTPCPQVTGTACRPAAGQAGPRPLGADKHPRRPPRRCWVVPGPTRESNDSHSCVRGCVTPRGWVPGLPLKLTPRAFGGVNPAAPLPIFTAMNFPPSPPAVWQGRGCRQTQGQQG